MFITYLAEEISDESIAMVLDNTRRRVIKDELKALNWFIVPTCWDVVLPAHTPNGCHLYESGNAISYKT
jgi:hypothetical protein